MALVAVALLGCAEEAPPRVTVTVSWDVAPAGVVWLWARVEGRDDPAAPGRTLAGQGPIRQAPGEPVEITFDTLAEGAGRVVVVEARWAQDTAMPVRWYGVSEPIAVQSGDVAVTVAMQPPAAEVHPARVELVFDGISRDRVSASEVSDATVRVGSVGAVGLVVANDPAGSANALSAQLVDLTCEEESVEGVAWEVCEVPAWDLLAGLPATGDGTYTVYVWLIDAAGYSALPLSAAVVLDTTAPQVLGASVTPNPAADGDEVVVSLTIDEAVDLEATWLHATSRDTQPAPIFLGPEALGAASSTYRWVATLTHEHDGATVDFAATLTDRVGNVASQVALTAGDGAPLVLSVSP